MLTDKIIKASIPNVEIKARRNGKEIVFNGSDFQIVLDVEDSWLYLGFGATTRNETYGITDETQEQVIEYVAEWAAELSEA